MNRDKVIEHAQSIGSHADVIETFVADNMAQGRGLELELSRRANFIEARLAKLRAAIFEREEVEA